MLMFKGQSSAAFSAHGSGSKWGDLPCIWIQTYYTALILKKWGTCIQVTLCEHLEKMMMIIEDMQVTWQADI